MGMDGIKGVDYKVDDFVYDTGARVCASIRCFALQLIDAD